jgi:transcription-repair coupling factor (superfamily II helicase)
LNSPLNLSSSRIARAASLPSLPRLPPQPGAHRKAVASPLTGSSDAPSRSTRRPAAERGELIAVICAEALAAQRLAEEIAWFAPALRVATLPDWETLPYDHFSPHQDLVSERLATLYRASRGECDVLLVAATTALYRFAPPSYLAAFTFFLAQGERLDVDALRSQLALGGYQHVTQVVAAGEFSVRGGLIDLFPMGSVLPYRIDLFDEEIESIKSFDVDSQRTLYPVPNVRLLPAREFRRTMRATRFRGRFRELFERRPVEVGVVPRHQQRSYAGGIEYYLPLFFDATATLAEVFSRKRDGGSWRRASQSSASGKTPSRAIACCAAIPARPLLPPHMVVPAGRRVQWRPRRSRGSSCLRRSSAPSQKEQRRHFRRCRSIAAPAIRCTRSSASRPRPASAC